MSRRAVVAFVTALGMLIAGLGPAAFASHEDPSDPNDPLYAPDAPAIGLGQWGPRQIRVEGAWDVSTGAGSIVAIVDTGVDIDHEDLAAQMLPGATFLGCSGVGPCGDGDWQSGPAPRGTAEASFHGTHVAGIAAAATNNATGIVGIARDSQILPVKVIDDAGATDADIEAGIRWAVDNGADVINLSLGVTFLGLVGGTQLLTIAFGTGNIEAGIQYAHDNGVVVVAAAGNEFGFPLCADPAFASGAICVTASDSNEAKADYANQPISTDLNGVTAPGGGNADFTFFCGGGVLSTVPMELGSSFADTCGYPANGYDEVIGTSMATPHVTGVAALLKAQGCSRVEVVNAITSTARQPGTEVRGMFNPVYGYGIVDAEAAVSAAADTCDPTNDPPVANDDNATTLQDTSVVITVLGNDTDPNGDTLTVSDADLTSAEGGTVTNNTTNVTYTPPFGYLGFDSFGYTASDGNGGFDSAVVTVKVLADTGDPCVLPGTLIVEDPADDQDPIFGSPAVDLVSLHGAGQFSPGQLVFTMEVTDLTTPLPPNATWRTVFTSPDSTTYFVEMATDVLGTPTFGYGTFDGSIFSGVGDADAGSFSADDDTITITISTSLVGSPTPGDTLTSVYSRTDLLVGAIGSGVLVLTDETAEGNFVLGNCLGGNTPPVAVDDLATTTEGNSVVIDVVANDFDLDGDPISVDSVDSPTVEGGTTVNNGNGTVTYNPPAGFTGTDSFEYTITDGRGGFDTAEVTVDVREVGGPCEIPGVLIVEDAIGVAFPGDISQDIRALYGAGILDTAPPLIVLSIEVEDFSVPSSNGSWRVRFDFGGTTWWVGYNNILPDPAEAVYGTFAGSLFSELGPADFLQIDGDVISIGIDPAKITPTAPVAGDSLTNVFASTHSSISAVGTGVLLQTDFTDPGTLVLEDCTEENRPPVANDDGATTLRNTSVVIDVLANDSDPDSDPLTISDVDAATTEGGVATTDGAVVTYTPPAGFTGGDVFGYEISDGRGGTDTAVVTVTVEEPPNRPPVANDDSATTNEDQPVNINVLANDSDPDGDPISVDSVDSPTTEGGTATDNGDGTVTYTPPAGFFGTDTFSYTITDGEDNDDAVVSVSVNGIPDAVDDSATTNEDTGIDINVLANDTDPENDPLMVDAFSQPAHGTTTPGPGGTIHYEPDPNYNGPDSFTYTACDDRGACDTATVSITVNPVNDPPTAGDDSATVQQGGSVNIDVLDNDSDPDNANSELTVTIATPPSNGTAVVQGNGTITYTHNDTFTSSDSFTYRITDPGGLFDVATVNISVTQRPQGGGKVTGGGYLNDFDGEKINFGFNAKEKNDGSLQGNLLLQDKEIDVKIHLKTLTSLGSATEACEGFSGENAMEFRGDGKFNNGSASFRVCVQDNMEPGNEGPSSDPDRFFLECLSGCDYDTDSRTPNDLIDGGNIQIHQAPAGGSGGSAPSGNGTSSSPAVLITGPLLASEARAGVIFATSVIAYDQNGDLLRGAKIDLVLVTAAGQSVLTGVTNASGVATFDVLIPVGGVELIGQSGALGSNAVSISAI